ncbi:hypothetical protein J5N97_026845 [Dioscorea zingiberensis]|uniref:AP2/ERF domain-containing protein n=1 Tax=Dioscorea zingiberensis TaxID=325984 RepID=A0A9D5C2X6_9LILI|nr:hypothetical protein J5N97_026845 [Dioscorea zingiberensis]
MVKLEKKESNESSGESLKKVKRMGKRVARNSPPQRTSIYKGVTRHRWTGRYEAHLWDKNTWNESQNKKGRQGAYDDEEAAGRAYDLAALKYWGPEIILNFPLSAYQEELKEMEGQSREEYIGSLRRKSNGFSRGVSKYRGVARHHQNGRWEARIGRVIGNKYLYLGTYATEEEAAIAYDMAAIKHRGINAVTNFDLSLYINDLQIHYPNTHNIQSFHQSSTFEETIENTSTTTTTTTDLEPLLPPKSDHPPSGCNFPDDIQTYFECQNGENYVDDEDAIFGDIINSFPSPMFQYELYS